MSIVQIDAALSSLSDPLLSRCGGVFYSGQPAFSGQRDIYILGLNPGGVSGPDSSNTISRSIAEWRQLKAPYSSYVDDQWEGKAAGQHGLQPRVRHMADRLGIDLRMTPASNVVFVQSRDETALAGEKELLLEVCWPIHAAVIAALEVKVVLCLGRTAGSWSRQMLGANEPLGKFNECNNRGWASLAHRSENGVAVITLTHPSRADWRNRKADPSGLVLDVLAKLT